MNRPFLCEQTPADHVNCVPVHEGAHASARTCGCTCHETCTVACRWGAHHFCEEPFCTCGCGHFVNAERIAERGKWAA